MKAILITVRTGSTRLPNKSTLQIKNKPTIEYVIDNVKKSKYADKIILCTTNLEQDKVLCEIANKNGIEYSQKYKKGIVKSKIIKKKCKKKIKGTKITFKPDAEIFDKTIFNPIKIDSDIIK